MLGNPDPTSRLQRVQLSGRGWGTGDCHQPGKMHGQAEAGSVPSRTPMKRFWCGFVHRSISTVVQNVQMTPKWMRVLMSLLNPDFLDGSRGSAGKQSHSCIYLAERYLTASYHIFQGLIPSCLILHMLSWGGRREERRSIFGTAGKWTRVFSIP